MRWMIDVKFLTFFQKKFLTLPIKARIILLAVVLLQVRMYWHKIENCLKFSTWRDDRAVEGARLESVCT